MGYWVPDGLWWQLGASSSLYNRVGGHSNGEDRCGLSFLNLSNYPENSFWYVGFQMDSGIQDPYFVIHGLVEVSVCMRTQGRLLWQATRKQRTIPGVLGAGYN